MEPLSAIVVLIEHNVYSVYIVPANVASTENMNALRALRNSILQKYGRQDYITLQRVLVSETDQQVKTFQDVFKQVEAVVESIILNSR